MATCLQCGRPIQGGKRGPKPRFCSDTCRRAWWADHPRERRQYDLVCAWCRRPFSSSRKDREFCCQDCANKAKARADREEHEKMASRQVWSCGGGVQSTAIAVLIIQGKLPKPDAALIVDTGREKSSTWEYYETTLRPGLEAVGIDLVRLPTVQGGVPGLYDPNGGLLLPVYRRGDAGERIKFQTHCSYEWKRRTSQIWVKSQGIERCDVWIGISTDEMRRVRISRDWWYQYKYPLVELGLRRSDCLLLIERHGWPRPPRTSCWMCPQQNDAEWADMRDRQAGDWAKALALEQEIRQRDDRLYLHPSMRPLPEARLDSLQMRWDDGCSSGFCLEG